ncbi:SpoIIE family protein phosphatase [Actinoplanes sp. URMC 104]|uniref:SpoIIE family protein phosphatase n=1 Tax=Actinoplanes sp. URMC 104 TaxID=3423409 RepID=UPI003F1CA9CE
MTDDLFAGGGATGRLMSRLDWSATDVGPVETWSQSMRAAVRIVLSSRYPMLLLWGPTYTQLYNDAYSALIGDKHPDALGGDVRVTLAEGWDVLEPLIADARATGVASWVPALQLALDRSGYREEAYFSVSHAPARDDDGTTAGILTVCSEVTEQVVGERRLRLLRDLAVPAGGRTADVGQVCTQLCAVIGEHRIDVPFAAIYLRDGAVLRRAGVVGADGVDAVLPRRVSPRDDGWNLLVAAAGEAVDVEDVAERLTVTGGAWDDPVRTAVALPLPSAERSQPLGVLLAGVSPSRGLDETYRSFFELLAQQVAVAVRNAQAYQEERDRAAALAELDRVKTDFFTNVSHEFRTPLTLMMGPLTDALADAGEPLGPAQRDRMEIALRSANRLLSLVNNLLTFSSVEAGRAEHRPRPIDLARYTAELAGVFRAAVERADLRLVVDCPPLPSTVAVDPGNWEKIVTNLLSNALKFTFVGEIRVRLTADATTVRLTVSDTGIGIAPEDLPRLFDRFHRVRGAQSRSHEGSGIGLALVRELARLQGGEATVESTPGVGTTFTVTVPLVGAAVAEPLPDMPAAQVGAAVAEPLPDMPTAQAAAREAVGWLDVPPAPQAEPSPGPEADGARILVADDNSDMRAYLRRLLSGERWQVELAPDGRAALEAIRRFPPDLLLTDVMMPRMDGFALVRAVRADEATRALPVIMLSARAGDESGVEGLEAGADDYVVKPFTAAELVARVRNTLRLARVRATHTRQLSALADTAAVIASGRALEEAFQAVTEQARALLQGTAAEVVVSSGDERPPLRFTSGPAGPPADGSGAVRAAIRGRDGEPIGTLTVLIDLARRPSEQERGLLEPMATMLASLAQTGWQLEHDRQLVLTLQQSTLPDDLPDLDGWELHAAYRPAAGRVGGDWYDVLVLPDGDVLLSIGDVAGHGLGAAVLTGQVRNAVRAYAVEDAAPATVVTRVAGLLNRLGTPLLATLFVLHLRPGTGDFAWCSAGHPTPVYSDPEQDTHLLQGVVGPPLGLRRASYRQNDGQLPPGAQLLLYTDGLVENFPSPIDVGLARLQRRSQEGYAAGASATAVLDAVLAEVPQPQRDDIAALILRRRRAPDAHVVADVPDLHATWTYPLEPSASGLMRRDLRAALSDHKIDPDLLDDLQVAATEAVNNAVEHAQQPSRPDVEVQLRVLDGTVRIVVRDFGGWRARPTVRDRGRGAMLMSAYGDVRVVPTATGTTVTIERRWRAPTP